MGVGWEKSVSAEPRAGRQAPGALSGVWQLGHAFESEVKENQGHLSQLIVVDARAA